MRDCPYKDEIAKKCPCVEENPSCPRIGTCCDCIRFHRALGEVPECIMPVVEKIVERRLAEKGVKPELNETGQTE